MSSLLITAATALEIQPFLEHLRQHYEERQPYHFHHEDQEVAVLITGVGLPLTAYALGHVLAVRRYARAVHVGIAGAFHRGLRIGDVVEVYSDRFADLGAEAADGSFIDVYSLGLIEPDQPPFRDGVLRNPNPGNFLPPAVGLSVNKVHGFAPSIEAVRARFPADVETMESAAFFYACLLAQQPFLSIRAISNYVEPRNRDAWNIPLAIENLNQVITETILTL